MRITLRTLAASAAFAVMATSATAATVNSGWDQDAFVFEAGSPAYRVKGRAPAGIGDTFYIGVSDLGVADNREDAGYTYQATQAFSFSYALDGTISGSIGGTSLTYADGPVGGAFDALLLSLRGPNTAGTYFTLSDVTVNGVDIGDFSGATTAPNETRYWTVSDFTGAGGALNVAGTLSVFGDGDGFTIAGNEALRFEMKLGNSVTAPIPLPAAGWLLVTAIGGLALARRRKTA
jgi:hypothetical protein